MGHRAHVPRARRPYACSAVPTPEAQAVALPPLPVMVPPDYCTPQLPGPPGSPSPEHPAAACMGRGYLQGGEDCPPLLDRQTGGVGVETWRAGGFGAPPQTQGPGQCGGRAPPTCQAPSSLLRCLAGSHLPALPRRTCGAELRSLLGGCVLPGPCSTEPGSGSEHPYHFCP